MIATDYLIFAAASCSALALSHLLFRRWAHAALLSRPLVLLTAAILLSGYWFADYQAFRARAQLEGMVAGYAPTYAEELQNLGHAAVSLQTSPDDPLYLTLIRAQVRWLQANPSINDIYTLRQHPATGDIYLLVDSETDYDHDHIYTGAREQRTAIGEVLYPAGTAEPEVLRAFAGERIFSATPDTDRWGTWVSAWSPLYTPDGHVEAVLGIDFDAAKWLATIAVARYSAMGYVTLLLALVVVSGATTARLRQTLFRAQSAEHHLRREIERRAHDADALFIAKNAAEEAARAQSAFLANISHEIRTPMTAVLGFLDLLIDPATPTAERERFAHRCRVNGQHLLALINNLLDLSKIEAGRLTLESVACLPGTLIREVCDTLRPTAAAKTLDLACTIAPAADAAIITDPTRLRQIALNLISNAIKFTPAGRIAVTLDLIEAPAGPRGFTAQPLLRLTVTDSGPGIPANKQARIFEPFRQADDSMTRKFGGTGLGLPIARQLARLMGGDITVSSPPNAGATFSVLINAAPAPHDARPVNAPPPTTAPSVVPSPTPAPALAHFHILLAEDGIDNQRLIRLLLERAGARVTIVENGQDVLDRWQSSTADPYSVILLDMQMPVRDGYSAATELRRRGCTLPVIAITAHALAEDRARCLAAGCDDYLTKPLNRAALVATCLRLHSERAAA